MWWHASLIIKFYLKGEKVVGGIRSLQLGACCVFGVVLAGCAGPQRDVMMATRAAQSKAVELNAKWAGQPYKALLAAYGAPSMIMEVPYAAQKTSVAIYSVIEKGNAQCSHAFTIVYGKEPVVQNYFCQ